MTGNCKPCESNSPFIFSIGRSEEQNSKTQGKVKQYCILGYRDEWNCVRSKGCWMNNAHKFESPLV